MGLNSCNSSTRAKSSGRIFFRSPAPFAPYSPYSSTRAFFCFVVALGRVAMSTMSFSRLGRNSCSGGSRRRIVTGNPSIASNRPRGRGPKREIQKFDTFVPMSFESATTIIYRMICMSALLLSLSTDGASQGLTVHDPGVRGGNAGAGGALPGISAAYNSLFAAGLAKFSQEDQVVQDGLGPRMNLNSCAGCHGAPATGGSSPKLNPQFAFVNGADHGNNTLPSFITRDGPTREVRFKIGRAHV